MNIKNITLQDILDLDHLQRLQDTFATVASITTVVIDPAGMPITRPSNLYGFCEIMQGSERGVQKCMVTNSQLCAANLKDRKPASLVCPHSGLVTAAVPIFLEDRYLGSWLLGQVRIVDPEDSVLESTAKDICVESQKLKDVLHGLPVLTSEEFNNVFLYLEALTETLIKLAQAGYETSLQNEKLVKISHEMERTGQMLTRFADFADVAMYVSDRADGKILMANEKFALLSGFSKKQLLKMASQEITRSHHTQVVRYDIAKDRELVDGDGQPTDEKDIAEIHIIKHDSWWRRTTQAICWADGRLANMVTYFDVTQERRMQEQLEKLAYYDVKMHLPNMLKLSADIAAMQADNAFLLCLDINALRRINDAYGDAIGDELLSSIVHWLQALDIPHSDIYRLRDDEFGFIVQGSSLAQAKKKREKYTRGSRNPGSL